MNDKSNSFWLQNPSILLQQNKLQYFFPNSSYSMVENLNAVVRMLLYLSVVMILYTRNAQYLMLPLGGMLISYILFRMYPEQAELFFFPEKAPCDRTLQDKLNSKRRRNKKECVKPTVDNPFMNFNYITDDYHRPPACKAFLYEDKQSDKLKKNITNKFNEKLYRDVSDIYNTRNGQREFFTVAYNGIPDQTSFAKWLYGQGPIAKTNGLYGAPYTGSLMSP